MKEERKEEKMPQDKIVRLKSKNKAATNDTSGRKRSRQDGRGGLSLKEMKKQAFSLTTSARFL